MCAAYETWEGKRVHPGDMIEVRDEDGKKVEARWSGFARQETLRTWKGYGCLFIKVEAFRFAVKAEGADRLIWEKLPPGGLLQALVDRRTKPMFKLVTRESTAKEKKVLGSSKVPLIVMKRTPESEIVPGMPEGS